jgi:ArsR family transcriptional regulator, lead/cadmium/zinc/bismuth-responsive transcriptional repressor
VNRWRPSIYLLAGKRRNQQACARRLNEWAHEYLSQLVVGFSSRAALGGRRRPCSRLAVRALSEEVLLVPADVSTVADASPSDGCVPMSWDQALTGVDSGYNPSLIGMMDCSMNEAEGGCGHDHPSRSFPRLPEGRQFEGACAMFRALGDPFRLRLLARLANGEVCVTELAELEREKLSTVSARLQTLHAVRLVKRRREAKHIFYALSDHHVLELVPSALEHAAER